MITWTSFIYFAIPAVLFWAGGAFAAWKNKRALANSLTSVGILVFLAYIIGMWISLERPPMRSMGETRLWYSFFMPIAGIITYIRWRYKWILSFSTIMAFVFIMVNILKPEIHNKALMPALQSPWFAPHVIVYMFSYAMLGAAAFMGLYFVIYKNSKHFSLNVMHLLDNMVYVGLAFLTIGMLFGALWAKEAWGHYWSWDPKETWAAATWLGFLIYIHYRHHRPKQIRTALWVLIIAFLLLQVTWYGINYLPSASTSVHTYNIG